LNGILFPLEEIRTLFLIFAIDGKDLGLNPYEEKIIPKIQHIMIFELKDKSNLTILGLLLF
jgi:hypothetical protein